MFKNRTPSVRHPGLTRCAAAMIVATLIGCASRERPTVPPEPSPGSTQIEPVELKQLLDARASIVLIDCRTPDEVAGGVIPGAVNIPLQEQAERAGELSGFENKPIVVYCRSGRRSAQFAEALRANGFRDVRSMSGGTLRWEKDVAPLRP